MSDLPPVVPNLDYFYCGFCGRRPEHIEPRWHGPHIEARCVRCGGRLGGESHWLSRSKYGMQECRPPATADPGQRGLFDSA